VGRMYEYKSRDWHGTLFWCAAISFAGPVGLINLQYLKYSDEEVNIVLTHRALVFIYALSKLKPILFGLENGNFQAAGIDNMWIQKAKHGRGRVPSVSDRSTRAFVERPLKSSWSSSIYDGLCPLKTPRNYPLVRWKVADGIQTHNTSATRALLAQILDGWYQNDADYDIITQIGFPDIQNYINFRDDPVYKEKVEPDHYTFTDPERVL
jgi:hypothetical protein